MIGSWDFHKITETGSWDFHKITETGSWDFYKITETGSWDFYKITETGSWDFHKIMETGSWDFRKVTEIQKCIDGYSAPAKKGNRDNLGIIFHILPQKTNVLTPHQNHLTKMNLMRDHNICHTL